MNPPLNSTPHVRSCLTITDEFPFKRRTRACTPSSLLPKHRRVKPIAFDFFLTAASTSYSYKEKEN